ncbi:hypothetical protein M8C21_008513 [Ambrosia artemisiifolia]|uniref:Uncharacterized protein n=1 Tax=Ambrosia artemisiifolia TaxID=4212 RepID=A0AAD5C0S9_AMBAR|nr:hypothetical protein M8C21_008513 [Ambrosia artemisiifolia]
MACFRTAIVRTNLDTKVSHLFAVKRCIHAVTQPPPLDSSISPWAPSPPLTLPETDRSVDPFHNGFGSGIHFGTGSMELMAVPKKKTSPHKRGIRNGPKALKPIPVIIRFVVESNYLIFSAAVGLGTQIHPMVQLVDHRIMKDYELSPSCGSLRFLYGNLRLCLFYIWHTPLFQCLFHENSVQNA